MAGILASILKKRSRGAFLLRTSVTGPRVECGWSLAFPVCEEGRRSDPGGSARHLLFFCHGLFHQYSYTLRLHACAWSTNTAGEMYPPRLPIYKNKIKGARSSAIRTPSTHGFSDFHFTSKIPGER